MGFSLFRWRNSGRDWSRGEPPPRGSVEYCGVPDAFQPPPKQTSPRLPTRSEMGGKIWEITAAEIDAANRFTDTIARSVDYARQVHGDSVLTAKDASSYTDFYKRWKKFAARVSAWSLVERAKESNKKIFEALLQEANRMRDRFVTQGMPIVPVPYMADLVLMLRRLPQTLTPKEMASRLVTACRWGIAMVEASRTTAEKVRAVGTLAVLGPAGLLFTDLFESSQDRDRRGLVKAIEDAQHAASLLSKSADASTSYSKGDPVYDEFVRRATRIYIEAAGLFGIQATKTTATSEAIDAGAKQIERGSSGLLWLLGIAGVSYLGARWLESRKSASEPETGAGEGEGTGDVVVVRPGDTVHVAHHDDAGQVYDAEEEEEQDVA